MIPEELYPQVFWYASKEQHSRGYPQEIHDFQMIPEEGQMKEDSNMEHNFGGLQTRAISQMQNTRDFAPSIVQDDQTT